MKRTTTMLLIAAVAAILTGGCRSAPATPYHIAENFDFSSIKKVAVLPFDNLTNDKTAGDAVRQVVINELLITGLMDVSVPGDAVAAVEKAGVRNIAALDSDKMKTIGNNLKVQGLILGSVERYGEIRSGTFTAPEVTVTLMMADVTSGSIVWSVTKTHVGDSFVARHFGSRSDSMSEAMIRVVRDAVRTLTRYGQ